MLRTRSDRDRRAWKGRYFLRDLAGFAAVERLLAAGMVAERRPPDVIEPDPPPDMIPPGQGE
jgi:hypothetical protein